MNPETLMSEAIGRATDVSATAAPLPLRTQEALDPAWLSRVLAPLTGGAPIESVDVVEVIRTTASKIRFRVQWDGGEAALCLKAFLDMDGNRSGGDASVTEADFYRVLAPELGVRVPDCVSVAIDREGKQGIIIMPDLIEQGATFCSALDPFTLDEAADSLGQIARLHAGAGMMDKVPDLSRRIADLAAWKIISAPDLQTLLDGPRGRELDARTRDAARLIDAFEALARADAALPATLLHGDAHAGNAYRTAQGVGLVDWQLLQRGSWALDVAYHICAVLPFELAERGEWDLVDHYLETARALGATVPGREEARAQYRAATVYGYYLWAITRRVDPAITEVFNDRLGKAVMRHDGFAAVAALEG